jgi:hypothetical protein
MPIKKLRIFLSYSTRDKYRAGRLKFHLEENYGTIPFLAHEDIEPSEEWKKRILHELDESDVYVALLTKRFKLSKWTSQEAGIAIARNLKIVPLWVSVKPYGFMEAHQAKRVKINQPWKLAETVVYGIQTTLKLRSRLIDGFLDIFLKSDSFQFTNEMTEKLKSLGKFKRKQIMKLVHGALSNNQIYNARKSKYELFEFVEQYQKVLPLRLWKNFCRKFKH